MAFDIREFEQIFTPQRLKRGLVLFQKGLVEPLPKPPGKEYRFLVGQVFKLIVFRQGDQVLSSSCSCEKLSCEHVCAVLFYFQKDTLGIAVKKKESKKPALDNIGRKSTDSKLKKALNAATHESLITFIEDYATDDKFYKARAELYFFGNFSQKALHYFSGRIKTIMSYYPQKLNQVHIDSVANDIRRLLDSASLESASEGLYQHLALFSEFPEILGRRLIGFESELLALFSKSKQALDAYFREGLSASGKAAWLSAIKLITANNAFGREALFFLIPRTLVNLKKKGEFELIQGLLGRDARTGYFGEPNIPRMIRIQLSIREFEVFKKPLPEIQPDLEIDWVVARAELDFCREKKAEAFKLLDESYKKILKHYAQDSSYYLDLLISKAAEHNNTSMEVKYLKESVVRGLQVSPKHLCRLFSLWPANSRTQKINTLLAELKEKDKPYALEKIILALLLEGRIEDVATELEGKPHGFNVLHRMLLLNKAEHKDKILPLYATELLRALTNQSSQREWEYLGGMLKIYLQQLTEREASNLLAEIMKRVEKETATYTFIRTRFLASDENL